jgi:hypothetical protein
MAISDGATKGYVDLTLATAVAAVKATVLAAPAAPTESSEYILTCIVGDNSYVRIDGTSVMGGGLDMGRFGIGNIRDPTLGSDVSTKGYTDQSIVPLTSKVDEITNSVVKLDGSSIITGTLDMGRNSIKELSRPNCRE